MPSLLAEWRNRCLPQTMGLELPAPGNATFQITFSFAPNVSGMSLSSLVPVPLGPRKRSQMRGRRLTGQDAGWTDGEDQGSQQPTSDSEELHYRSFPGWECQWHQWHLNEGLPRASQRAHRRTMCTNRIG